MNEALLGIQYALIAVSSRQYSITIWPDNRRERWITENSEEETGLIMNEALLGIQNAFIAASLRNQ